MKPVTLEEVEQFLREQPLGKLHVSEVAYFSNTEAEGETDPAQVGNVGEDIKFHYRDVTLRRFDSEDEAKFVATGSATGKFIDNPEDAYAIARALIALELLLKVSHV